MTATTTNDRLMTATLEIRTGKDNKMYTLWFLGGTKDVYIKNLSTDEDEAIEKARAYAKDYNHILNDDIYDHGLNRIVRGDDVIRFGKHKDKRVSEVPSGYLHWVKNGAQIEKINFKGEPYIHFLADFKLQEAAKNELINRGELVEFEGRYISPKYRDAILADRESKQHYFNVGERVELHLTIVKTTGYDSAYGWVSIYEFKDENGRSFFYKGTKYFSKGEHDETTWYKIKATIEHNEYNGTKQTMLKRPTIVAEAYYLG